MNGYNKETNNSISNIYKDIEKEKDNNKPLEY